MIGNGTTALFLLSLLASSAFGDGECTPAWEMEEGLMDPCTETKEPTTCALGQMEADSSADGLSADASISGDDGTPLCSVENQTACAGSASWNFTFTCTCAKHAPYAFVNGLSSGDAEVDAEYVICIGAHSWSVVYGVGEVKCSLWDINEVCICTLEAAKDSDSEWTYIGTITIKGVTVPFQLPVVTASGPVTGHCSQQGAGGGSTPMFSIIYHTSIHAVGHADGCLADTSEVTAEGDLSNNSIYRTTYAVIPEPL